LLAVGERHASDRGPVLRWEVADVQALPFADGDLDVVSHPAIGQTRSSSPPHYELEYLLAVARTPQ
jgi:hypothetical protein